MDAYSQLVIAHILLFAVQYKPCFHLGWIFVPPPLFFNPPIFPFIFMIFLMSLLANIFLSSSYLILYLHRYTTWFS